jgi:hypothetical protein
MNMFKLPHKQTSKEGAKIMKVLEKVILSKANTTQMGPFTMVLSITERVHQGNIAG